MPASSATRIGLYSGSTVTAVPSRMPLVWGAAAASRRWGDGQVIDVAWCSVTVMPSKPSRSASTAKSTKSSTWRRCHRGSSKSGSGSVLCRPGPYVWTTLIRSGSSLIAGIPLRLLLVARIRLGPTVVDAAGHVSRNFMQP